MKAVWQSALLRKSGQLMGVILATTTLNFFLLRLAPGDAVDVLVGESGAASVEFIAKLKEQFGLDQPLWVQYLKYLWQLCHLDLGHSFRYDQDILGLIAQRVPATLLLMVSSLAIALCAGCLLGAVAARYKGRWPDILISSIALLFHATPLFWVGMMLMVGLSIELDWLPIGGMTEVNGSSALLSQALDVLRHLILPAFTLALFYVGIYVRLMRAALIDISHQDYLRTAKAKGLRPGKILNRHLLRNAWLPIVTMVGTQVGAMLGGSVLVETVFGWPGLGRLAYDALFSRDLNVLLGILLFSTVLVLVLNLLIDLLYRAIDPRIELHK
jgi:peptide/nickel transport system permease protein